jgi:hypothetical protein
MVEECAVRIYSEMAKVGVQGMPKVEVEKCVHVQSIVYCPCQSRDGPF